MVKGGPRSDGEHLGGENMEDSSDEDDTNDEEDSEESDQEERQEESLKETWTPWITLEHWDYGIFNIIISGKENTHLAHLSRHTLIVKLLGRTIIYDVLKKRLEAL